jgi:hypothetical protein
VAAVSVRRQVRATRALAGFLRPRVAAVPPELTAAVGRAGLTGRVELVDDAEPFSFTYGVVSPRVAVSRGLAAVLAPAELEAVLHHERYHVRNWDTLKVVMARAAPAAFFFLPALGYLRDRYLAGRELAADRRAVAAVGERPLVGALYNVLERPAWSEFGAAAALGGAEFLDMRVGQLESGRESSLAPVPRWAWGCHRRRSGRHDRRPSGHHGTHGQHGHDDGRFRRGCPGPWRSVCSAASCARWPGSGLA